jgi:hypothetical protein
MFLWLDVETYVSKILNLRPTRMGTLKKIAEAASNITSMSVSNFRGLREDIFTAFVISLLIAVYGQGQFRCFAGEPRRACRKGLTGLRGGPYGIATGPPLHHKSGPVVTPGGPYCTETVAFQDKSRGSEMMEICVLEKP